MIRWLVFGIYNLAVTLLFLPAVLILLAADPKFRQSLPVRFRRNRDLDGLKSRLKPGDRLIWIHSASMGEFEQARPLITSLKKQSSSVKILATFMSPSGYEARKNYPDADLVQYIPLDTPWGVWNFYRKVRPEKGILIRYEFWPDLILFARFFNVPLLLVNASLKPDPVYARPGIRWFFRPLFLSYSGIFTVSDRHTDRFNRLVPGHPDIRTLGDSRFDQVILRSADSDDLVQKLSDPSRLTVIAGSSWPEDEKRLLPAFFSAMTRNPAFRLIVVPHEIHPEQFPDIQSRFPGKRVVRFSDWQGEPFDVLWVDLMGRLMKIYQAGSAAWVGGGFGFNIHNILEPAVYGMPVAHGPNYHRSPEAWDLLSEKITTVISDGNEAERWLSEVVEPEAVRKEIGVRTREFVFRYQGVTGKLTSLILPENQSTNQS